MSARVTGRGNDQEIFGRSYRIETIDDALRPWLGRKLQTMDDPARSEAASVLVCIGHVIPV